MRKGYEFLHAIVFCLFILNISACGWSEKFVDRASSNKASGGVTEFDKDGDGLTNAEEIALGTDPEKSDSDDDGINDGTEHHTTNTDPLNEDTDGGGVNDGDEISDGTDPNDPNDDQNVDFSGDSDQDGLTDAQENSLGTNPNDADTDGDGLSDGAEVNTFRTDPLKFDTDDGGIGDGLEVSVGTDPLDGSDDLSDREGSSSTIGILFTETPDSITSRREGRFLFSTTSSEKVESIVCSIDEGVEVPCLENDPFEFSGLGDGVHRFMVKVTDDKGATSSATFMWKVGESVSAIRCAEKPQKTKVLSLMFAPQNNVCEFGVGGNLTRLNGFIRAVRTERQSVTMNEGETLCGLELDVPTQQLHFDDHFLLSFNGNVLATNASYLVNGGRYDSENALGQPFGGETPFCFGSELGAECSVPKHDTVGMLKLSLPVAAQDQLMSRVSEDESYFVEVSTFGDNDNTDCQHSGVMVNLNVKYVD